MTKEFSPDRLDIKAFTQAGARLSGHDALLQYQRLAQEAQGLHPDLQVDWSADGQLRTSYGMAGQSWLQVHAQATVPMLCQRCLRPVDVSLTIDRAFRFVADEKTAEELDNDSEEDLLVFSREFNLRELIEDELLMELPVVPRHEVCPETLPMQASDVDFEQAMADKPNPFAALAGLSQAKGLKNNAL